MRSLNDFFFFIAEYKNGDAKAIFNGLTCTYEHITYKP